MIRKANKEDATYIAKMAIMMWDGNSVKELAKEFKIVLDNEECTIYLYCIDHLPIGFAQCGLRHDYVEGTESSLVGYLFKMNIGEIDMPCICDNRGMSALSIEQEQRFMFACCEDGKIGKCKIAEMV